VLQPVPPRSYSTLVANAAALSWKNLAAPEPGPGFAGAVVVRPLAEPAPPMIAEPDLFSLLEG
jgi:hypothetical protein